MIALLNPSKTVLSVAVRHYTKHSLAVWLELWNRGEIKVLYTTAEWDEHQSSYGSNWIEFKSQIELKNQVPYQMDLKTCPLDEWGWKEDKNWFHTPTSSGMMRMIRTSK
jgi:hypothetical protein